MEKKIQDYLHLYYGCQIMIKPHDEDKRVAQFVGFTNLDRLSIVARFRVGPDGHINCLFIKPILRPLSDITEDEDVECGNIMFGEYSEKVTNKNIIHYEGEKIKYLLSKHFDLFGLHEAGLCLYREDLK